MFNEFQGVNERLTSMTPQARCSMVGDLGCSVMQLVSDCPLG
jgi:hypothetical protein